VPSGRTHDVITLILAVPAFIGSYFLTSHITAALVFTTTFLFGGLMFGPDLDTGSKQYWRWRLFRPIWLPYRALFRHRSRFTHGLFLGPLIRVVYFQAVLAILFFAGSYVWTSYSGGHLPGWPELLGTWQGLSAVALRWFGVNFLLAALAGMWFGAASHSIADLIL